MSVPPPSALRAPPPPPPPPPMPGRASSGSISQFGPPVPPAPPTGFTMPPHSRTPSASISGLAPPPPPPKPPAAPGAPPAPAAVAPPPVAPATPTAAAAAPPAFAPPAPVPAPAPVAVAPAPTPAVAPPPAPVPLSIVTSNVDDNVVVSRKESFPMLSAGAAAFAAAHQRSESALPAVHSPPAPAPISAPSPSSAATSSLVAPSSSAYSSSAAANDGTLGAGAANRRQSSMLPASIGGSAPAMTLIRAELMEVFEKGRGAFATHKEFSNKNVAKKLDPDGRLASMINRLWYRMAYLINAKYLGNGSDLMKEAMMLLTVLCEVRQTVVDVFEFSKSINAEKVSSILVRHAWLFEMAKSIEDLVGKVGMKLAQFEGKNRVNNNYVPQLLDAPLALFEDRLANYTYDQQQALFDECNNLRSLRSQVESYLSQNYEVALISLFITEAVGKAVGILLPQKEKRKLYFASILSTYSVCRANSWMLLRANHTIDLGKTASKLNVVQGVTATGTPVAPTEHVPGAPSVGAADLLRQNTVTNSTTRSLPNVDTMKLMNDGIMFTGYFQAPNLDDPIVQKMQVWYDLIEGTCGNDPSKLIGKKGALFWVPEKAKRVKSNDCALPISDITDILLGKQTKVFQTNRGSKANPGCCVTLVSKGGYSMNFEAATKEALTSWMNGLTKLANASGKKMYEDGTQPKQEEQQNNNNAAPVAAASSGNQYFEAAQPIAAPAQSYPSQPEAASTPTHRASLSYTAGGPGAGTPASPPLLSTTSASTAVVNAQQPLESVVPQAGPPPVSELNGGWIRCTAPDGHHYYWNSKTQQSVWLQPAEFVSDPNSPPVSPANATVTNGSLEI